jgi:hypothetical protein
LVTKSWNCGKNEAWKLVATDATNEVMSLQPLPMVGNWVMILQQLTMQIITKSCSVFDFGNPGTGAVLIWYRVS